MRDRETDSWWSIMSSDAIGGELDGAPLVELPISEKATWADWSSRHPDTLVLSVDGREHVENNPYDSYFASDGTFRNLEIDDDRLPPKEPIYSFFLEDRPHAVAHSSFEGGKLFPLKNGRKLFLYRDPGVSMFASSEAWVVNGAALEGLGDVRAALSAGQVQGASPVGGFDTFWYSWVAINGDTQLLE